MKGLFGFTINRITNGVKLSDTNKAVLIGNPSISSTTQIAVPTIIFDSSAGVCGRVHREYPVFQICNGFFDIQVA